MYDKEIKYLSKKYLEKSEMKIFVRYLFDSDENFSPFFYDYIIEFFKDNYTKQYRTENFYFDGTIHIDYFFSDDYDENKARNLYNSKIDIFNKKFYYDSFLKCFNQRGKFECDEIFLKNIYYYDRLMSLYEIIFVKKAFSIYNAISEIYRKIERSKDSYHERRHHKNINTDDRRLRENKWNKDINTLEKYEKRQNYLNV